MSDEPMMEIRVADAKALSHHPCIMPGCGHDRCDAFWLAHDRIMAAIPAPPWEPPDWLVEALLGPFESTDWSARNDVRVRLERAHAAGVEFSAEGGRR